MPNLFFSIIYYVDNSEVQGFFRESLRSDSHFLASSRASSRTRFVTGLLLNRRSSAAGIEKHCGAVSVAGSSARLRREVHDVKGRKDDVSPRSSTSRRVRRALPRKLSCKPSKEQEVSPLLASGASWSIESRVCFGAGTMIDRRETYGSCFDKSFLGQACDCVPSLSC